MFTAKMILHRDIANPRIKITRANDTRNNFTIKKKIRFSSPPLIFELSCKNVGRQTKPTDKQNFPISCSHFRTFAFFPRNRENERDCFPFFVPARNKSVVKRERAHLSRALTAHDTPRYAIPNRFIIVTISNVQLGTLFSYELAVGETERVAYMINRTFPPLLPSFQGLNLFPPPSLTSLRDGE